MKKVLKTTGWVLVGIFVIYTFYFLWKQSQPAPVVYELVTPEQRDVVQKTVATGTLEARTQVELKPQITGVITDLRVHAGQTIKAGELVAVIRVIPDMNQLTQAQNSVESARISLEEVERGQQGRERTGAEQSRLCSRPCSCSQGSGRGHHPRLQLSCR